MLDHVGLSEAVRRHAGAFQARSGIEVRVRDSAGLGMRERARLIDVRFEVGTVRGSGTTVAVRLPIAADQ